MDPRTLQRLQQALIKGWPITWDYYNDNQGQFLEWDEHWLSYADGKYHYRAEIKRGGESRVEQLEYTAEALIERLKTDQSFASECESAHQRARLQKIDDIIKALEGGARLYEGGEDYRGAEVVGGEVTLLKEGDCYLYQSTSWHGYGSPGPRETTEQKLGEKELRSKLLEDDPMLDFCLRFLKSLQPKPTT